MVRLELDANPEESRQKIEEMATAFLSFKEAKIQLVEQELKDKRCVDHPVSPCSPSLSPYPRLQAVKYAH